MTDTSVDLLRAYLTSLGLDDQADPELERTPERVTEMLRHLFSGMTVEPPQPSTFPPPHSAEGPARDPVVISAIPFQSMCVHHLLPFFGTVDVAYVPEAEMIGFGSIGRIVDHFARRPQVQERLIVQIADHLQETIQPRGLLVRLRARQLCMEMRGAMKSGELISIAARGNLDSGPLRRELLEQFRGADAEL